MSYILKLLLKTPRIRWNTQKGIRILIAIIAISLWMGCLSCYGEKQNDQILSLFKETQQASVFYLDNGMEVILVENHASPMIAAVTVVKTGSRNEDEAINGSAHFLEHL